MRSWAILIQRGDRVELGAYFDSALLFCCVFKYCVASVHFCLQTTKSDPTTDYPYDWLDNCQIIQFCSFQQSCAPTERRGVHRRRLEIWRA
jgi:hypothetical protein